MWGSVVSASPLPLEGLTREEALGGTEMQDRLHILEDLNMLYIRQMALSLEVMSCSAPHPHPRASMHASHPQSLPCSPLLGLRGEGGPAQSGERDRWFCMPCLAFTEKGKGTLGQHVNILLALEMAGSCLFIYS